MSDTASMLGMSIAWLGMMNSPAGGHDIIGASCSEYPFFMSPGTITSSLLYCGNPSPLRVSCDPRKKISSGVSASTRMLILGSISSSSQLARRHYLREAVEKVVAVCGAAAQHHALAVVALLHTGIEVAVLVACEEELFHQVERLLLGQHAAVDVMAEIGVHVLVETPQRIVVIASLPDREMEDAQQLQRLAQRPGAARTHGLEHLGCIRLPRLAGMDGVTPRKLLHGLDAERHRPQEDTLFLVERIVRQAGSDFGLPGIEPKADGGFVVGRYVADRPALVDVVRRLIPSHSCGVKISGTSVTVRVNTIFSPGRITGCSARIRAASISAERLTGGIPAAANPILRLSSPSRAGVRRRTWCSLRRI